MKNSKENTYSDIKTYTVAEVDEENAKSFIDGYAHGFNIFMEACEKSLRALDTVMGFYMEDDLGKFDDRVNELHLAHNSVRFVMAQMADAYDTGMHELKDLHGLEGYVANID